MISYCLTLVEVYGSCTSCYMCSVYLIFIASRPISERKGISGSNTLLKSALSKKKVFLNLNQSILMFTFPNDNTFSWGRWGWTFIIMLSQNDQNSSSLGTCSVLVAPSHPSNLQNSPLVISTINTTKSVPLNVCHASPHPPIHIVSIYLDFS